jgi:hypothetical protein
MSTRCWNSILHSHAGNLHHLTDDTSTDARIRRARNTMINLPWFTNSFGLLLLPVPCWSLDCATVLIEDKLLCDWIPLLSISWALVLQKSSDKLAFLTERPWILNRLEGSSTAVIGVGLAQQPKQPLLCSKPGWASKRLAPDIQEPG